MKSTRLAFAQEASENSKVGLSSCTYVSQASTCPDSCPLKPKLDGSGKTVQANGCYGNGSMVAMHVAKLNQAPRQDGTEAIRQEVEAIDGLSGRLDLRCHVVGDCPTKEDARLLSGAMARHRQKKGKGAWTYTHNWRSIPVEYWQGESALASCDSLEQVKQAQAQGYATATIVDSFESERAYEKDGVKLLPCPFQTKGVQCVDCRLCLKASHLKEKGLTVAFVPHGGGAKRARIALGMVS